MHHGHAVFLSVVVKLIQCIYLGDHAFYYRCPVLILLWIPLLHALDEQI
jgi:hypothetical protein